jgi:uncharacterized SAM-binding protein YcdF (DUF218 family)
VTQAVDYYKRGIAPHIIFSSGFTYTMREAEVMRELAIGLGVPGDAISIEAAASNTRDNVAFVTRMLRERDWRDIALVSSPYHMRRALLTWRRVAPDITVVPLPLDTSEFYAHRRTASFEQIRAIAHEYVGIATYWWKGWI